MTLRLHWLGAFLVVVAVGQTACIDQPSEATPASSSVTVPPPGVGCIEVKGTAAGVAEPAVWKTLAFNPAGMATAGFNMGPFPIGPVTFQASGYGVAFCRGDDTAPLIWSSTPLVIDVTSGRHRDVVTFQPGDVEVLLSYEGTTSPCPEGQFQCRTRDNRLDLCSDHLTTAAACGASCTRCGRGEGCLAGFCVFTLFCPPGQFSCVRPDGSLDACSDHASNSAACGPSCAPCGAAQTCIDGVCTTAPMPSPPSDGLVFWVKGDNGLVPSSAGSQLLAWANSAVPSPNPGLFSGGVDGTFGPAVGVDSLDGIPGITFSIVPGAYMLVMLGLPGDAQPKLMKDRNGNLFGYGPGETQARTTISVVRPAFARDIFGITGGTLLRFGTTPTGGLQDFETLFDFEPLTNFLAYFSNNWRSAYLAALQGPLPTGGSTIGGVPFVIEHSSSGFDDINAYVNGLPVTLTPGVMPAEDPGHPRQDFFIYGAINQAGDLNGQWHGARFEDLIYDVKLTGAARTQVYTYLASRYPSIQVVIP